MKALALTLLTVAALASSACGDSKVDEGNPDAGMNNVPQCATNPTTHLEIINACTNALEVDKTPVLPLLNADGTLPPLP